MRECSLRTASAFEADCPVRQNAGGRAIRFPFISIGSTLAGASAMPRDRRTAVVVSADSSLTEAIARPLERGAFRVVTAQHPREVSLADWGAAELLVVDVDVPELQPSDLSTARRLRVRCLFVGSEATLTRFRGLDFEATKKNQAATAWS